MFNISYTLIEVIFTKINLHNTELLSEDNNLTLSKNNKVGTIIVSLLVATTIISGAIGGINSTNRDELEEMIPAFSTSIVLDDINQMNLIINDNDCSDVFFQEVVDKLREDGITFTTTKYGENINQNNATIVTLDQQYSAGKNTIVFAPYDNARVGQSDSLALAMHAAFNQNGFLMADISCGKVGYEEDKDGNVHYYLPTNTENDINEGYDSSFVTISFGTNNINAEWVAKSIENGLARQNYYLNGDNPTDLIYRANPNDSIDSVADYFSTDTNQLKRFNNMNGPAFGDSQTIINPAIENNPAFDKTGMFQIGEEKTRAY